MLSIDLSQYKMICIVNYFYIKYLEYSKLIKYNKIIFVIFVLQFTRMKVVIFLAFILLVTVRTADDDVYTGPSE
jgi:hypothetical protein